jgi:DNA-binding response OmpR family regulator
LLGFTSNEIDIILSFLHSSDVVLKRSHLFTRLGSVESKEFSNLVSVG